MDRQQPQEAALNMEPLVEIFRSLYTHKFKILGGTILVAVVLAAYTLSLPNQYRATAALIIKQPEVKITGETNPLTIEMLQSLAESSDIKQLVYKDLVDSNDIDGNISFGDFRRMLGAELPPRQTRRDNQEPMMYLTATSENPNLSKKIANAWTQKVLNRSREIYTSDVTELSTFFTDINAEAEKTLVEKESSFTTIQIEANLATRKAELRLNRERYSQFYTEVLDLTQNLTRTEALIGMLETRLRLTEIDGVWIGDALERALRAGKTMDLPGDSSEVRWIQATVTNLVNAEKDLADFKAKEHFLSKKSRLPDLERRHILVNSEIIKNEELLAGSRARKSILAESLTELEEIHVLNKAITNDAMWRQYLEGNNAKVEKAPAMKTEVRNKTYDDVRGELIEVNTDIAAAEQRLAYFTTLQASITTELAQLSKELVLLESRKNSSEESIAQYNKTLADLREGYEKERSRFQTLHVNYSELQTQLKAKRKELDELNTKSVELEDKISRAEDRIASAQREIQSMRKVHTALSDRVGEIALLRVSQENASRRSGVSVLYYAEVNPTKTGPARRKIVMTGAGGAFALLCLLTIMFVQGGAIMRRVGQN